MCGGWQAQLEFPEARRYTSSLVGVLMIANMLGVSLNYTM